jgi:hypothetical protein
MRSPEEMEELYRQIVARDPRRRPTDRRSSQDDIGMLDQMIEEQASRRSLL